MNKLRISQEKKSQGYRPDLFRVLLRALAKIVISIFRINGKSLWGNVVIQQINPIITLDNPLSNKMKLKFHSGHERLHWRISCTSNLDRLYLQMIENMGQQSILFDIGANIGITSIIPAQRFGCKVFAFEPEPLNFSNLHKNIFENELQNKISYFPFAISNKISVEKFFLKSISPGDALHSLDQPSPYIASQNLKNVSFYNVATFSLDHLMSQYKLPHPTHLKIDVDGSEINVLNGMFEVLKNSKELKIFIEVNLDKNKGNFHQISEFLSDLNYKLLEISEPENHYSDHIRNGLFIKC